MPGGSHASVQAEATNNPAVFAALSASIERDNVGLAGDTLTFDFAATDYMLLPTHWEGLHALGGTTPTSVTIEAFWSDRNTLFDPKYSIRGPFSHTNSVGAPFSGFSANLPEAPASGVNPFSMTMTITITHGADELFLTQVDPLAQLAPVPVPAALPLLASAFGILGFVRSRHRA